MKFFHKTGGVCDHTGQGAPRHGPGQNAQAPQRRERELALRQDGTELAKHLKEFICRCAEHVRLLDYKRASLDRAADSPVHGYKMHVWAAPHQVRLDYLAAKAKANQQKREQIADTRQWNGWNASGWSDASGWRGSWNWSHNGWHGAWSQS